MNDVEAIHNLADDARYGAHGAARSSFPQGRALAGDVDHAQLAVPIDVRKWLFHRQNVLDSAAQRF